MWFKAEVLLSAVARLLSCGMPRRRVLLQDVATDGPGFSVKRTVLGLANSLNWDFFCLWCLYSPRDETMKVMSEDSKLDFLATLVAAYIQLRLLRQAVKDHSVRSNHGGCSTLYLAWDNCCKSAKVSHEIRFHWLNQNVFSKGHSYSLMDTLIFLQLHAVVSSGVATVVQCLDRFLTAGSCNSQASSSGPPASSAKRARHRDANEQGVERFSSTWWRTFIWVLWGRRSPAKTDFLVTNGIRISSLTDVLRICEGYEGEVSDNVTNEGKSQRGHTGKARLMETLVPITQLLDVANDAKLNEIKRDITKASALLSELSPPVLGGPGSTGYCRTNILLPLQDALGVDFALEAMSGPGVNQVLLSLRDGNPAWASAGRKQLTSVPQKKYTRGKSEVAAALMQKLFEKVMVLLPDKFDYVFAGCPGTVAVPKSRMNVVVVQEQVCQMNHCYSMIFRGEVISEHARPDPRNN